MKTWNINCYHPFPNISFSFTVQAETWEKARRLAEEAIAGIRITGCFQK
ncbi:hypothetical protein SmaMPs15_000075 [Stenotrophomonas maltophilia phage vB_SmaM_Ps15]|uniref:Uncharacterized protein n=1 Tax=Stenotrophomonas maltophilia phage vB_SmaM_Ps15 TaxID=3071007 RepID=A0AAE9FGK8_9CAUD|nr:hypothetical protein PQC01_gp075 [Stenotrophomonas maltophilia phage vB_SmaM_Ps15]UMO77226.1 hypothetical protein SmaMPs15_000075 [Stenotrophomonas maltophilia phage vB_SmaM_Ps15]